ncbi:MAG: MATE family efflux transporter [Faecalicatena sp.]|uniref:MATE family efflux transporter n=1 Tax=Faecalicatena sp. TaxID=2005360 RepID=UPI002582C573|nr:MATE family efflux transporter [Faecalicatena sp.]MCI6466421.1 MATE family efflux transporter [Faecalicatena sp.]MDY5618383.1 MATE family efflux transporter [Lachnospiraceae bacterium]
METVKKKGPGSIKQDEKLGSAPLGKLIIEMALPAVAAQIINVLYNIVDRIYIGHIHGYGDMALTGVGVTFPILMVISAFSAFAGMGGAPLASIQLGKKNYEKAEQILGNSVGMLLIFSVILTVVFSVFKNPILYAFGASDTTIVYASQYISIYLLGTIFVQFAVGLNTYISGQGNAKTAMLSVLIGAVTNIVLDPIFIFVFGMGVRGAALATIISQALSAVWVIRFLTSKKSVIRIRKKYVRLNAKTVGSIAALGVSPFIMQSTESLVMITLNSGLQKYGGDLYVGTMSIMSSIMQLIIVPVQGVSQGVQPIMSYNYGAGKLDRVKGTFIRVVSVCLAATIILAGIAITYPSIYAKVFTANTDLIELTCSVMPIYFLGITVFGIQMTCQSTFLALGEAKVSLIIALLRKVILLIPLAIILPKFMGVMGVYRAEPIADFSSVTITVILFIITAKKILRNEQKNDMIE